MQKAEYGERGAALYSQRAEVARFTALRLGGENPSLEPSEFGLLEPCRGLPDQSP